MHKTTRKIWTAGSSSAPCLMCDLQLLSQVATSLRKQHASTTTAIRAVSNASVGSSTRTPHQNAQLHPQHRRRTSRSAVATAPTLPFQQLHRQKCQEHSKRLSTDLFLSDVPRRAPASAVSSTMTLPLHASMNGVGTSRHQLICKYTTKPGAAATTNLSSSHTSIPLVLTVARPSSSCASCSPRVRASMAFSTISTRHFSKSVSTSAIATNLEAELSATSQLSSSELSSSLSAERPPILTITTAVEKTASVSSSNVQFLFPENMAKFSTPPQDSQRPSSSPHSSAPLSSAEGFDDGELVDELDEIAEARMAEELSELEAVLAGSGTRRWPSPWLNASMVPGNELEESLRKAIYEREAFEVWWPLYEMVAKSWRGDSARSSAKHSQGDRTTPTPKHHLGRTDFERIIAALKVAPTAASKVAVSKKECLPKLEQVFDDFHRAITRPKSNVSVYKGFLKTLRFWRMDDQIPQFVHLMKTKIIAQERQTLAGMFTGSDDPSTAPEQTEQWSEKAMEAKDETKTGDEAMTVKEELPSIECIREGPQEQYHDMMQVLAELGQTDALLQCLEDLKSGQYPELRLKPTILAYDTVLRTLIVRRDSEGAAKILQEMNGPKSVVRPKLSTFNILLSSHLYDKDARATQQVFESLLLTDIRPDLFTFNMMMQGYLKMGEIDLVYGYYKGLGEYGLEPNIKTYRILMKAYLRQGHLDKVLELFSKLKESPREDLALSSEDYRVLMQGLADHGRVSDALNLLQDLRKTSTVSLTTPIYNVFLTHYARRGEIEKAQMILDKIVEERLPVVDGSVNPLIRAYLAREDLAKVGEMVGLMDRYGFRPSTATYNIMIHSTKYGGGIDVAEKLYQRMREEGSRPDIWTFNTMLDLVVRKLIQVNDENSGMIEDGERTDADGNTYQEENGIPGEAPSVGAMDSATTDADSKCMLSMEQKEVFVRKIESLLHEMQNAGVKADVVTYAILIRQYVALNDVERAEILFREMTRSGVKPDSYAFNTLMNGFTLVEEMDKAMELYRRMPKYGVEPDVATFSTLIKGFKNVKQYRKAKQFKNSLKMCRSKNGKTGSH